MRRFAETEVFEHIFYRILKQAMEAGLVDPDVAFVDSTHVKANKHKFHKKLKGNDINMMRISVSFIIAILIL